MSLGWQDDSDGGAYTVHFWRTVPRGVGIVAYSDANTQRLWVWLDLALCVYVRVPELFLYDLKKPVRGQSPQNLNVEEFN